MRTRLCLLLAALGLAQSAGSPAAAEPGIVKAPGAVQAVAFSPDGKLLACGCAVFEPKRYARGEVVLWDVAKGERRGVLTGHPGAVACLAFRPDGKILVSGGCRQEKGGDDDRSENIKVWDVDAGREQTTLLGQGDQVTAVAFSPDGKTLASAGIDGTVKLRLPDRAWKVRATLKPPTKRTRQEPAFSLAFDPQGRWLAVGVLGGTIEIWDLATLRPKHTLRAHEVKTYGVTVAVSPDGKTLAGSSPDGTVRLWDTKEFQIRKTFDVGARLSPLAFSPDNSLLAVGEFGEWERPARVLLWDVVAGRQIASLEGHKKAVCSLAFSGNGRLLASGSYDETARIWPLGDIAGRKTSKR